MPTDRQQTLAVEHTLFRISIRRRWSLYNPARLFSLNDPHGHELIRLTKHTKYLGGHTTPEVGIGGARFQHWRNDGLVLFDELPQDFRIEEEVVTIHGLKPERKKNQ